MRISEFLCKDAVSNDLKAASKADVITEMVGLLAEAGAIEKRSRNKVIETLMAREALGSTAIGQGIAIPHGKSDATDTLVAALGISKRGVNFDSLDGEPAHIFFLLIAPVDSSGPHLKALARVSRLLKDKFFRQALREAKTPQEAIKLIKDENEY